MTTVYDTAVAGLYVIPLPTPFPIGPVNAYLAVQDEVTLIDVGVKSDESYAALVDGLTALNLRVADIDRILITHHHTDHIGLVDRIAADSGAEVWCHAACVPYVERPQETRERLNAWTLGVWQEAGAPESLLALTGQLLQWFVTLGNGPVRVTRVLEDCDWLELAGRKWQVLHTPGHAGDLICLLQPDDRILLSSDHLLRDVSSNALVEPPAPGQKRPRRLLEYMAQLERVAALTPEIAYGGHGKPTRNIPEVVRNRLAFHRKRAMQIHDFLADAPLSLYEISELVFPNISEAEKFLALSEVLGHVDWLEHDGLVERVPSEDGIVRWRVTR
ncbi:MAG: MBL fold metallo-hydrolase [Anaerolineae bacterium]